MSHKPPTEPEGRWRRDIVRYLTANPNRQPRIRELAKVLDVPESTYPDFRDVVRELIREDALAVGSGRRLSLPDSPDRLVGRFHAHERGFGFISITGRDEDLFVPRGRTNGARDGDTVAARLGHPSRRTGKPRGEVVRIIERAPLRCVGQLERAGKRWLVRPQGRTTLPLMRVDDPGAKGAQPGDLVVIEPVEHTLESREPRAVILERLGDASAAQSIVLATIRQYDIPDTFPDETRAEAQRVAAEFAATVPDDRVDLRDLLTFTIDPTTARDFDDAITLESLGGGKIRLGVHIADVAHFVTEGAALDVEAQERGNSVYFPQKVVPMLPEILSNGVCSLQPGVDRFTKSAFITYDQYAGVVETSFANSVIRSDQRLTYDQVTDVLERRPHEIPDPIVKLLKQAEKLARRIRQRRLDHGMLVLNLPEVELAFDRDGNVTAAAPADTSFSHTIIEMFMVEANEAVCRHLNDHDVATLRRIHPEPDPENTAALHELRPLLGREVPETLDRETLQLLLRTVRGRKEEPAVNMILLRSMTQAEYSPNREGHFALASEHYCHFTSPIRRYPDLVVHRQLDALLRQDGKPHRKRRDEELTLKTLHTLGTHTSKTERRAQSAERDAVKAILLEYMSDNIGATYDGIITGVISFGVFVQVFPPMAEGLIRTSDFPDDRWEFDEQSNTFYGAASSRLIHIGQSVRVTVAAVDRVRQEMTLVPAEDSDLGVQRRRPSAKTLHRPKAVTHRTGGRKARANAKGKGAKRKTKRGKQKRSHRGGN